MPIYKRILKTGEVKWEANVRRAGHDPVIRRFKTKKAAEDFETKTKKEMIDGTFSADAKANKTTIADALDRYVKLKDYEKPRLAPQAAHLKRLLGRYTFRTLTKEKIAEYRDTRLSEKWEKIKAKDGKPAVFSDVSPNTVRLEMALLSGMYSYAQKNWGVSLGRDPTKEVTKPNVKDRERLRRLTAEEEEALFQQAKEHGNVYIWIVIGLALETSLRLSNVTQLRLGQIDLKNRVLHHKATDVKNREFKGTPLTTKAVEYIEQAKAVRLHTDTDLLFPAPNAKNEDGTRKEYDINTAWRVIKQRAGITDLHFHDLRHESVSRFVELGLGDLEVASISGHKTMQMLKRYAHLRNQHLVDKIDRLQGITKEEEPR